MLHSTDSDTEKHIFNCTYMHAWQGQVAASELADIDFGALIGGISFTAQCDNDSESFNENTFVVVNMSMA